jgi:AraC family transcriptional regulator
VSAYETHHARGDRIAPHRHELGYAAVVLEGAYEELSADGVWRAEAGDLILHPAFHLHLNRFEARGARVLNVALPHAALRKLSATSYAVVRLSDPDRMARKAEMAEIDAVGEALESAAPLGASPPRDWLDRFAAELRASPQRRVGDLARAHGVTPEHAARAFARRFGMAPAKMRSEHRLQAALRALGDGLLSLAQVATQAGYADQAHFTRAVAAATGASPARLRRVLS